MTGLCIILIDAVVARQETEKGAFGRVGLQADLCRRIKTQKNPSKFKRRMCYFFNINVWI